MKYHLKNKGSPTRRLHKPYIKNRVSFTSEFFPNERASRSMITAGASGSFNIRPLTFIAAIGVAAAALTIYSKLRK